jgi:hypothetical protein
MVMTHRECFLRTLRYEPVARAPLYLAGPWPDTLERWRTEGLPADVQDVHEHLGVKGFGYRMTNITPIAGPHPTHAARVLREEGDEIYSLDAYGRTVRNFKSHTSMPEWIEFPVKDATDLRRYLDEHFDVADLDARFAPDWADKAKATQARGDIVLIDGGGFDKRIVAAGPAAVKAELARLAPVIREGGFVCGVDHSVPADVSWDNYRRYIDLITKAVVLQ